MGCLGLSFSYLSVLFLHSYLCGWIRSWLWQVSLGTWDLSSPTGDWTFVLCIERQILNRWTPREVPVEFFVYSGYPFFVLCAAITFPQSVMVLSPSCPLYPLMWFCPMQMLEWGQSMLPHSGCCLTQHLSIHVSEKTWNRFQGHPLRWEKQDSFSSFSPPTAFSVSMCLFFRTVITGWLRAAEIYFLTVEEARGLKSKCWQSWLEETKIEKDTCTPAFIAALLTVARVWKQPRCLSIDEWIKKLWYIYTMEYYSAIKRNTSVLMRWMNLEPIIPSVVSQKKKNKYCV